MAEIREGKPALRTYEGDAQVTSLSSSVGLSSIPSAATGAVIECEAQQVRYRVTGSAPTSTVGHILNPGDILDHNGDLFLLRFIETASGAKLNVSFYS